MRAWVEVLKGRAVTTPAGEPVGEVDSAEVDTGSWRVIQIRVALDGAVATKLSIKRPLLARQRLDVPSEQLSDAGGHLRVAGGYEGVVQLASAQGVLPVERMNARLPKPAERRNPEPPEDAGGPKPAEE